MEESVYKFLDNYFGDEIKVQKSVYGYLMMKSVPSEPIYEYVVLSKIGDPILSFRYGDDIIDENGNLSLRNRTNLYKILPGFFPIDRSQSLAYICIWFCRKHQIRDVRDIEKLVKMAE